MDDAEHIAQARLRNRAGDHFQTQLRLRELHRHAAHRAIGQRIIVDTGAVARVARALLPHAVQILQPLQRARRRVRRDNREDGRAGIALHAHHTARARDKEIVDIDPVHVHRSAGVVLQIPVIQKRAHQRRLDPRQILHQVIDRQPKMLVRHDHARERRQRHDVRLLVVQDRVPDLTHAPQLGHAIAVPVNAQVRFLVQHQPPGCVPRVVVPHVAAIAEPLADLIFDGLAAVVVVDIVGHVVPGLAQFRQALAHPMLHEIHVLQARRPRALGYQHFLGRHAVDFGELGRPQPLHLERVHQRAIRQRHFAVRDHLHVLVLQQQGHFLVGQPFIRLGYHVLPLRPLHLDIARAQQQRILDRADHPYKSVVALERDVVDEIRLLLGLFLVLGADRVELDDAVAAHERLNHVRDHALDHVGHVAGHDSRAAGLLVAIGLAVVARDGVGPVGRDVALQRPERGFLGRADRCQQFVVSHHQMMPRLSYLIGCHFGPAVCAFMPIAMYRIASAPWLDQSCSGAPYSSVRVFCRRR